MTVDVTTSSQYASAVLLVAPCAPEGVRMTLQGSSAAGYIDLTVAAMREWGATVERPGPGRYEVPGGMSAPGGTPSPYRARRIPVEYDASAAAHLLALAVATGGEVTVTNAGPTVQPDAGVVDVFEAMGARVTRAGGSVTVAGPPDLRPVTVDLRQMPDQVTTLAALASLAPGVTRLTGVAVARGHETDRLAALAQELGRLGVRVDAEADALTVHGPVPEQGVTRQVLQTHDDHRLAMAFAALGARTGVGIDDPGCVRKTYPGFFADAAGLGLRWEPA